MTSARVQASPMGSTVKPSRSASAALSSRIEPTMTSMPLSRRLSACAHPWLP
jgi:hypothetical protein